MSTPQTAIIQSIQSRLSNAIHRGQEYLFSQQNPEGYWWAELEANVTLTAEYIMLHRILMHSHPSNARSNGKDRQAQIQQMARYLLRQQRAHGGWELYYGDGGEISTTIEAYFALKLAGHYPDDPSIQQAMQQARKFILERGGLAKARVFTKLHLALFGAYPWEGIPTLPPWFMFLPSWFPLNIYTMASWARSSTVPLLVLIDKRPVYDVGVFADELFAEGSRDKADVSLKNNDGTTTGKFFLAADKMLKTLDQAGLVPFRKQGIAAAERWVIERQDTAGDWAGIVPAMLNSILMFHALGVSANHPYIKRGLDALDRFCIEEGTMNNSELPQYLRLQPCISPTWDTALGLTGLLDSGASPTDSRIKAAGDWLLTKQIFRYGDWAVFNRKGKPAGWAFEFFNDYYPDVDDTAAVIMALLGTKPDDDEYKLEACRAATEWVMTMQCRAGGWAAFDIDNTQDLWNQMPYGDLKAMIDPPTADLTGRVLELLGHWQARHHEKLYRDEDVNRAISFLLSLQEKDGSWWGRWGVNYVYGTYLALVGLRSISPFVDFNMEGDEVQQAAAWLRSVQNADGGWGETCESYKKPELRGKGPSTPSQTAWALMGLMAAGQYKNDSVKQGIEYLLSQQNPDGSCPEAEFTGTGFPGHFYINYHQYRNQFPLTALGRYATWLQAKMN
ncbi:MAG: squalene--hopene cyclase [Acidobacteriota bacterium]|nr:squalene--hopene cyclase [Acidobacteriota bacterium]